MNIDIIWNTAFAIIGSVGGASFIIIALSSWLGKIWAKRIMEVDRSKHAKELEQFRLELSLDAQQHYKKFEDKLSIYRAVVDIFTDMLFLLQASYQTKSPISPEEVIKFEKNRMKTYGYLAMLASQEVLDAHESLVEDIVGVLEETKTLNFPEIRNKCLKMINAARIDMGVSSDPIKYTGNR